MKYIEEQVRTSAQQIIKAKRATYYGIGMAMVRITKAFSAMKTASSPSPAMLRGEYGESGVYAGIPCIVNRNGVQRVLSLPLTEEETSKFHASCQTLHEAYDELNLGL